MDLFRAGRKEVGFAIESFTERVVGIDTLAADEIDVGAAYAEPLPGFDLEGPQILNVVVAIDRNAFFLQKFVPGIDVRLIPRAGLLVRRMWVMIVVMMIVKTMHSF